MIKTNEDLKGFARGLRRYAKNMLKEGRLLFQPKFDLMDSTNDWSEVILHRDGRYQTELVILRPFAKVVRHKHMRCSSLDIALSGNGTVEIDGVVTKLGEGSRGDLLSNLVPIGRGVWHGGEAGDRGAMFISFQYWEDDNIGPITSDWVAYAD